MRCQQRQIGRPETSACGLRLVPIGVEQGRRADLVEPLALFGGQSQIGCSEVVAQLRLVASADDDGRDGGAAERPSRRHLGGRDIAGAGDIDEDIDDRPEPVFVSDRRLRPACK
jgi:hypothetical protein